MCRRFSRCVMYEDLVVQARQNRWSWNSLSTFSFIHISTNDLTYSQIASSVFGSNVFLANIVLIMDPSARSLCTAVGSRPIDEVTRSLLRAQQWDKRHPLNRHAFSDIENQAIKALGDRFETLLGTVLFNMGFEVARDWLADTLGSLVLPIHEAIRQSSSPSSSARRNPGGHTQRCVQPFRCIVKC